MCGRYTLTLSGDALAEAFDLAEVPELSPRYNVAPTQEVATLRQDAPGTAPGLTLMRWGLIPRWAKDKSIGNRMINARSETVAEKPAYRGPFKRQRCLILADGFYEWMKMPDGKQPFHIRLHDGEPFAIAGLWDRWKGEDGTIESCTLLTTSPNPLVGDIHNRMPVILPREHYGTWLDPSESDRERLERLLVAYPAEAMEARPVSRLVNSPANDSPACLEAVV